jgi:hypothetical protein
MPDLEAIGGGCRHQACSASPRLPVLATVLTATATTVRYHSRDTRNADIAVTGTVFTPGGPGSAPVPGLPAALAWLSDHFAGRPAPTTCS